VHLGKGDGSPLEARERLGEGAIVGVTVHDRGEVMQAITSGVADYLGIGPFRRSPTKGDFLPVLKESELDALLELSGDLPAVVIGGVTAADVANLIGRGAHGVAVCSSLFANAEVNLEAMLSAYGKAMEKAA
jgi:thiamine-phosphate pyrophosphorylase